MSCQLCKIFIGGGELNAIFAQQQLRHELGIPLSATVLLSVGEVNRNKNHQLCITALAQLHKTNLYYVTALYNFYAASEVDEASLHKA